MTLSRWTSSPCTTSTATSMRSRRCSPIRGASRADAVVVGGDAVPGPFAAATLARLEAVGVPVHWIRGNGEREVASATGGPPPAEDDMALVTAAITATELGEDRSRALGELPSMLELDGVLYCHATPRSDEEILTRLSPAARWEPSAGGRRRGARGGRPHPSAGRPPRRRRALRQRGQRRAPLRGRRPRPLALGRGRRPGAAPHRLRRRRRRPADARETAGPTTSRSTRRWWIPSRRSS